MSCEFLTAPVFPLAGPKQRGGQGGRGFRGGRGRGRGRGGKRSFERPPKKEGNEEVTSKNAHTQLDEGEPTEKKIKIEAADDWGEEPRLSE